MSIYTPIAYPLSFSDNPQRERLANSNQVLLPPEILQNEEIEFPVYFTISNNEKSLNVAVFEFTETPNVIYMPWFILNLLDLKEGEPVDVKMIEEEVVAATEITLMPHEHEFVTLTDPKAILEHCISKNYPILTENEIIKINYIDKVYNLSVIDIKPNNIVSTVNCDVTLNFERALDYVTPPPTPRKTNIQSFSQFSTDDIPDNQIIRENQMSRESKINEFKNKNLQNVGFLPFSGKGNRLGSK